MKFKKLTPNMMVDDVRESVKFYTDILGFTLNMVVPEDSKTIDNELKDGKKYVYAMVSPVPPQLLRREINQNIIFKFRKLNTRLNYEIIN